MKLVTYALNNSDAEEIGGLVEQEQHILRLREAAIHIGLKHDSSLDSILSLIRSGAEGLDRVLELINRCPEEAVVTKESVRFFAPVPQPEQLRCFSAFEGHAAAGLEEGQTLPEVYYENPIYYKGNRFSSAAMERPFGGRIIRRSLITNSKWQ